jgi:hypothetical protein
MNFHCPEHMLPYCTYRILCVNLKLSAAKLSRSNIYRFFGAIMYSNLSMPKGGGGGRSLGLLSSLILSAVFTVFLRRRIC